MLNLMWDLLMRLAHGFYAVVLLCHILDMLKDDGGGGAVDFILVGCGILDHGGGAAGIELERVVIGAL